MPLKTAAQLIEDEVKEYRKELMKDVSKRGELRADGFESSEIDEMIQQEKDEVERDVAEYRAGLMAELPQREMELAEERTDILKSVAFNDLWLPNCLIPLDGETSTLVTKEAYEHYLSWCEAVGISEPYSLEKVRSSLKAHYGIENMRTGLRAYRLTGVSTKVTRDQLIARYEAGLRKQEREAEKLRDLTCPYCERRKYDGNRFDRCYWCNRILKDGYDAALADYLSEGYDRTGASMKLAYQRMVSAGETEDVAHTRPSQVPAPPTVRENLRDPEGNGLPDSSALMNKALSHGRESATPASRPKPPREATQSGGYQGLIFTVLAVIVMAIVLIAVCG